MDMIQIHIHTHTHAHDSIIINEDIIEVVLSNDFVTKSTFISFFVHSITEIVVDIEIVRNIKRKKYFQIPSKNLFWNV